MADSGLLAAQSLAGLIVLPALAWMVSENRRALAPLAFARLVVVAIALQLAIALLLLRVPAMQGFFAAASGAVAALQSATEQGARMVFGYLAGGPAPFAPVKPQFSFILAFRALPLILVMSVLSRLFYHWGVLQLIVRMFARVLERTLGVSGPLGTATAANIFLGMVEAPLLVRPYVATMSRSALFATMTVGMATVAGTVLALYASILEPVIPGAAGHILAASVMSAPAALLIARLMVPETTVAGAREFAQDQPTGLGGDDPSMRSAGPMDAIANGTLDGLKLLAYVAAMLVVMVALVALANSVLALVSNPFGFELSMQSVLGAICAPLVWLTGIPWHEAATAGSLVGTKIVLNEFLAYLDLARLGVAELSDRSRLILTYSLCGFANLGSLGILVGGLVAIAPERRAEIAALGMRSVVAGNLATLMTGAVVGLVVWT